MSFARLLFALSLSSGTKAFMISRILLMTSCSKLFRIVDSYVGLNYKPFARVHPVITGVFQLHNLKYDTAKNVSL